MAIVKFQTEQGLQKAIDCGDVQEVCQDGKTYYSWQEVRVGKGGSVECSKRISHAKNIDEATFAQISDTLQTLGWDFKYSKTEQTATPQHTYAMHWGVRVGRGRSGTWVVRLAPRFRLPLRNASIKYCASDSLNVSNSFEWGALVLVPAC